MHQTSKESSDHSYSAKPPMASLLLPVLLLAATAAAADSLSIIAGCPASCGGVDIPYPFGIGVGTGCSRKGFEILCINNNGSAGDEIPVLPTPDQNIRVLQLSVSPLPEARVLLPVAWRCYNSTGDTTGSYWGDVDFNKEGVYRISNTSNELFVLGCNTYAYTNGMRVSDGRFRYKYYTGCITVTNSRDDPQDGACAGLGCCRVDIPPDLTDNSMTISGWSHANQTFCPCDYAFIVEKGNYTFKASDLLSTYIPKDLQSMPSVNWSMPLRLDWAIRDNGSMTSVTCVQAANKPEGHEYACLSNHSDCVDSRNGPGYFCNCSQGYQGNPYVGGGCSNINECLTYRCPSGSKCIDTDGGYKCQCNLFQRGKDCRPIIPMAVLALLGTFVAIFFMVLLLWFIYMDRKWRMKMACFDKNGGEVLKEAAGITIFTEKHLKKITNNYHTPIGKGAFGTVYLGTVDNKEQVAVKCSHFKDKKGGQPQQGGEFVNEITFQFQNSHPNLVRLVGCCLETSIPVLVYEYISNGSLYNLLHMERDKVLLLWTRLNIAIGSSEALAYMHSHGDRDRIHGDIKSANILLSDNHMPKVSDFGSSRLLSTSQYAMAVAADMRYMDPMYMTTHRFLPKSDVYSFGIVLLELITRKTVNYGKDRSLPMDFVKLYKENNGNARELYDSDISSHDGAHPCNHCVECLDKIGALAIQCLKFDVDERPAMAEVVNELKKAAELVDNCKQVTNITSFGPSSFAVS